MIDTSLRRLFSRAFGIARDAWLVIGMTIALVACVEGGYRVQRAVRIRLHQGAGRARAAGPRDPQAGAPWFSGYSQEELASRPTRWKSYVYWGRRPGFHGTYVNIDSAGHRVTPQPVGVDQAGVNVFLFGGSTMWGIGQRDDHTIAAEVARRLDADTTSASQRARRRARVTNFGENGFVQTQEVLALILALRSGARPDVVVFYDGINDVEATVQYGAPGYPQNEWKRAQEFAMGRSLDRSTWTSLSDDLHALAFLGGEALHRLAFVNAFRSLAPAPAQRFIAADSATQGLARVYAENVRVIEGLAKEYGFTPLYVWQPTLHATQKTLTPYEQRLIADLHRVPVDQRLLEIHRAVPAALDREMTTLAPGRFIDDDTLFRGDTLPVYIDGVGHTTEVAVPRIVESFWPQLELALSQRHRAVAFADRRAASR